MHAQLRALEERDGSGRGVSGREVLFGALRGSSLVPPEPSESARKFCTAEKPTAAKWLQKEHLLIKHSP